MGEHVERLNRLRDYTENYDRAYRVVYLESLPSGGLVETARSIECDSVEVIDGMIRFLDNQGQDLWAINANFMVEYWEVSRI